MAWDGELASVRRGGRRVQLPLAIASALVALIGCIALVAGAGDAEPEVMAATTTIAPTTTTTAPRPHVPVSTALAEPKGLEIPTFDRPGGAEIGTAGMWYGREIKMPVVEQRAKWVRIRLPERPNGSTAWVRKSDVKMSRTGFRIVIRLAEAELTVYKDGFPHITMPAGVGKPATPTAPGNFYVAIIEKPGPPGYGPIVLDTSGHSEAIQSWEGMGDAITAIHGPISASSEAQIGTTGAHISNGCIRLRTVDQVKLDIIPLGTPVDIVP